MHRLFSPNLSCKIPSTSLNQVHNSSFESSFPNFTDGYFALFIYTIFKQKKQTSNLIDIIYHQLSTSFIYILDWVCVHKTFRKIYVLLEGTFMPTYYNFH